MLVIMMNNMSRKVEYITKTEHEQSCHAPHSPHPPSGLVEQREFRIQLPGRLSLVCLFRRIDQAANKRQFSQIAHGRQLQGVCSWEDREHAERRGTGKDSA